MKKDLTNLTFGRLKVIKNIGTNKNGFALWECLCECGNKVITTTNHLKTGHTQSCGCLQKDRASETSFRSLVG